MSSSFNIILDTKELSKILSVSSSIVEKRNVLPILSHIKLAAHDNKMMLTATDMDLSINLSISAQIKSAGQITLHSETFSNIVRKISEKNVEINYIDETSQIRLFTPTYDVELSTLPAEDFPMMDNFIPKVVTEVNSTDLVAMLEMTKFAMSTEETRYNLNGVFLHSRKRDGHLYIATAATDGHRLASFCSNVIVDKEFGIILPRKTVIELNKIFKDINKTVQIMIGHNRVKLVCEGIEIISKLIDGSFPDYEVFIPISNNNVLRINNDLLKQSIDRVATIAIDKFPSIKITIMEDQIQLYSHSENKGLANEVIKIDNEKILYQGNQITIGLNPRYVLDVLSILGSDTIEFKLSDSFAPALIKSLDRPNGDFVVMPVKV